MITTGYGLGNVNVHWQAILTKQLSEIDIDNRS